MSCIGTSHNFFKHANIRLLFSYDRLNWQRTDRKRKKEKMGNGASIPNNVEDAIKVHQTVLYSLECARDRYIKFRTNVFIYLPQAARVKIR